MARSNRQLSPEGAASVRLGAVARKAGRAEHLDPDERARVIAELQDVAAAFPHLLSREAGLLIGRSRNTTLKYETAYHLRVAQLLIDAGADLAELERWTEIGYQRTHPSTRPAY